MLADWITWVMTNFDLAMFALAIFFIIFHWLIYRRTVPEYEIVYRWIALFAIGFTGLYAAFFHAFYPEISAANIGWPTSPFQWEVAMADLAIGVLAILSFKASFGFRLATVIGATIFLWGAAGGHIYQMIQYQNFAPGNAGTWFWMDIILPLILIICIFQLRRDKRW